MSNAFPLGLPHIVRFREKERASKEILEDSLKDPCFVDLGILGNHHVLHDLWIRYINLWCSDIHHLYEMLVDIVESLLLVALI